jgi:hypothetical protein
LVWHVSVNPDSEFLSLKGSKLNMQDQSWWLHYVSKVTWLELHLITFSFIEQIILTSDPESFHINNPKYIQRLWRDILDGATIVRCILIQLYLDLIWGGLSINFKTSTLIYDEVDYSRRSCLTLLANSLRKCHIQLLLQVSGFYMTCIYG